MKMMNAAINRQESPITRSLPLGMKTPPTLKTPLTTAGTPRCFSPKKISTRLSTIMAVPAERSIVLSSRTLRLNTGRKKRSSKRQPTTASVRADARSATTNGSFMPP